MARLVSRLNFIAERAPEAAAIAVQDTANMILELTKANVHVITGWLRDSYQKETVTPLHVIVGTGVDYSVFEEFGTSRRGPHPHFTPAWALAETYFFRELEKRIKDLG
jgi:HK97 gp10 family phage protein